MRPRPWIGEAKDGRIASGMSGGNSSTEGNSNSSKAEVTWRRGHSRADSRQSIIPLLMANWNKLARHRKNLGGTGGTQERRRNYVPNKPGWRNCNSLGDWTDWRLPLLRVKQRWRVRPPVRLEETRMRPMPRSKRRRPLETRWFVDRWYQVMESPSRAKLGGCCMTRARRIGRRRYGAARRRRAVPHEGKTAGRKGVFEQSVRRHWKARLLRLSRGREDTDDRRRPENGTPRGPNTPDASNLCWRADPAKLICAALKGFRIGEAANPGPYTEGGSSSSGQGTRWERVGEQRWKRSGGSVDGAALVKMAEVVTCTDPPPHVG